MIYHIGIRYTIFFNQTKTAFPFH